MLGLDNSDFKPPQESSAGKTNYPAQCPGRIFKLLHLPLTQNYYGMEFIFNHLGVRVRISFFVFLLMTPSIASIAVETNAIGFLLNDKLAFLAFNQVGNTILSKNQNLNSQSFGKSMHIFFDGKDLGQLKLLGTSKKCFKKYTKAETKNSKNCVTTSNMNFDSEILPPVPPTGPCPGDIGAEIQCPSSELNSAEIVSIPELITVSLSEINAKSLEKPFASKRVKFSWGILSEINTQNRPLLISERSLADPDRWHFVNFKKIPESVQKKIISEVLKHRKTQKCTEEKLNVKAITLSEKDLLFGRAYKNKKGDRFAVAIGIREIKEMPDCNGNEMGIPSAYLIYSNGNATDLLQSQEWNYRNLELLEAADANHDGTSELFFADYQYNRDGFSVYDFKTGKLTEYGTSSH